MKVVRGWGWAWPPAPGGGNFVETSRDGSPCLGVELEVCVDSSDNERGPALAQIRQTFPDLIMERDGSLDEDYGFEVVTNPLGRAEWQDYAPRLLDTLKDAGCYGYNNPAGEGYGKGFWWIWA